MPFDLLALVEKDETLATCQCFNAEVCYAVKHFGFAMSVLILNEGGSRVVCLLRK